MSVPMVQCKHVYRKATKQGPAGSQCPNYSTGGELMPYCSIHRRTVKAQKEIAGLHADAGVSYEMKLPKKAPAKKAAPKAKASARVKEDTEIEYVNVSDIQDDSVIIEKPKTIKKVVKRTIVRTPVKSAPIPVPKAEPKAKEAKKKPVFRSVRQAVIKKAAAVEEEPADESADDGVEYEYVEVVDG